MMYGKNKLAIREMKTRHLVEFHGIIIETTVTNKASTAQHWMQNIIGQNGEQRIVGLDCKYIHHPIISMSKRIALLQLCVKDKCLVLQLQHVRRFPKSIRDFLCDPSTTFFGVEIQENTHKLLAEYALKVNRKVDVHFLAKQWFPLSYKGKPSLKALAYALLGFPMRKSSNTSNFKGDWESRVLDKELVERATIDVYASCSIAHKLLKDIDDL